MASSWPSTLNEGSRSSWTVPTSSGSGQSSCTAPFRRAAARCGYGSSALPSWSVSGSSNGSKPPAAASTWLVMRATPALPDARRRLPSSQSDPVSSPAYRAVFGIGEGMSTSAGGPVTTFEPLTPERRRAMTRQHLLEAAAMVFARNGFHGSTLDEVAATAGFSKGAVYSNFKSKHDLFLELFHK